MDRETNEQKPSSTEGGQVNYKAGDQVCVLCEYVQDDGDGTHKVINKCFGPVWVTGISLRPVEPAVVKDSLTTEFNSPKILDSSSEPMREAFEAGMVKRYGKERALFARNENRYFDSSMEIAWQAFQAGAKYGDSSRGWEPTQGEIKYAMDRCGVPASDLIQAGDAVRFVSLGHERHRTEGVLKSIHHGPKNAYLFTSNCGQFHRYCTAVELERIIKRYRTPTLADLTNGPIECEYRDSDEEHWRSGFLVHVLNGAIPFLCVNKEQELSGQWDQCRIEVGE